MYLSRIRFNTSPSAHKELIRTLDSGGYGSHQLLWKLFSDDPSRKFLFREEQSMGGTLKGIPEYLVLSHTRPQDREGLFLMETKPFTPKLLVGQRLGFRLRANPTVFSQGKRHDVLMHAKKQLQQSGKSGKDEIAAAMEAAAVNWLCEAKRAESLGITFDVPPVVLAHHKNQSYKASRRQKISYTSVDYEGVLTVVAPNHFMAAIENGVGKSRAFGCGLFLLRRI